MDYSWKSEIRFAILGEKLPSYGLFLYALATF